MKKLFTVTAVFLLSASLRVSFAQNYPQDSAWIKENYIKKEVMISMRDGVKLFTSIYLPKDVSENHPILIIRTPYACRPYGEQNFRPGLWSSYLRYFARENYILVFQDVRGRFMSEGKFVDVRPFDPDKKNNHDIDEASDTYDTIDWLINNISNNNGNVGVQGISYPGFYATMAAASNHPALKAVSPQAPVTNWFMGDDLHHNGAFFEMDAFSFYSVLGAGFGEPRPMPVSEIPKSVGFPDHDNYKFFLEAGSLKNLSKYMGDSIAFWKELMAHPDYDEWWKTRDARNATKNLHPAMLWVGGLFDAEDCWGAWNAYKATEQNNPGKTFNKIVEGPWFHTQWATNDGTHLGNIQFGSNTSEYYQQHYAIPFFNYFLKGKGDISHIDEANVFVTGLNQWKTFSQWPPPETHDSVLYFQPSGKLGWNKSGAGNSFSEYVSDPAKPVPYEDGVQFNRTATYMCADQRFASRRPDVLVFQTDTLEHDLIITGNVIADLRTSISTTDADFVVKIIDVFPEYAGYNSVSKVSDPGAGLPYPMGGYQMLVRGEIFRGRYRKSYENPSAFTPGKIETVKFELPAIAHDFKKGHRIMIQIQSSWFPLADRNPQKFVNIYEANENDFQKATIKIYHDAVNVSNVILPVLK